MIYLWKQPEDYPDKHTAAYNGDISPHRFALMKGSIINREDFSRCDVYLRSVSLDLPDDPFIIHKLRHVYRSAYIFAPQELFCYTEYFVEKVEITPDNLNQLKTILAFTKADIDGEPRALADEELDAIASIANCPRYSRTPVFRLSKMTATKIQELYDSIPNNCGSCLVNQKIVDILLKIAPDDVQFFDAEVRCSDRVLTGYKLLNITNMIVGIDHERSVYTKMKLADAISRFKYLTYKPGCMGIHKLARDKEYFTNILATEEVKQAFAKEKVKGVRLVTPEEYYTTLPLM